MILHVSQSDLSGGAAISAYRLHKGLLELGMESRMLVHDRRSKEPEISRLPQWHRIWRRVRARLEPSSELLTSSGEYCVWYLARTCGFTAPVINRLQPGVVNLHGVDGIIGIPDLTGIKAPIVWTVHDEWAASCGYHFWVPASEASLRAGPSRANLTKATASVMRAKLKYWKNLNITIVSPSQWLAEQMGKAPHFAGSRIEVIPYGLEDQPVEGDRREWRRALGIPDDTRVITYGAGDALENHRKGDDLFFDAIEKLAVLSPKNDIVIMIFGDQADKKLPPLPFPVIRHGSFSDRTRLARIYGATDCFVCPSRADNLPNTVLEALSAGTPCTGFRVGGVPDMIVDGKTGYLAEPFDTTDLAHAIHKVLTPPPGLDLRKEAEAHFRHNYTMNHQAMRYRELYSELA